MDVRIDSACPSWLSWSCWLTVVTLIGTKMVYLRSRTQESEEIHAGAKESSKKEANKKEDDKKDST